MDNKKQTKFIRLMLTVSLLFAAFLSGRQSKVNKPDLDQDTTEEHHEAVNQWFSFDWPELVNSDEFKQHHFIKSYFNAEGLLTNSSGPDFPLLNFLEIEKYCAKASALKGSKEQYDDGALYCEEANYYSIAKESELVVVNPEIFFNEESITKIELLTSEHYCMIGQRYEIPIDDEVIDKLRHITIEASLPRIYNYQLRSKAVDGDNCPRYDSEHANYIATDLVFYRDDVNKIIFSVDFNQETSEQYGFLRIYVFDDYRKDSEKGEGYFLINLEEYRSLIQHIVDNYGSE